MVLIITSFLFGFTTVTAQIMIPLASEFASPQEQGKTIGAILSGVLLGLLLARTVSRVVSEHLGWRVMFGGAAVIAVLFAALLRAKLPQVPPTSTLSYRELMRSIGKLVVELPKLRQVSFVAAMLFAVFTAFWTTLITRRVGVLLNAQGRLAVRFISTHAREPHARPAPGSLPASQKTPP